MVFSEKFGGFHILQIKKTPKRRPFHPFPVDKVKHVQQLKGNEYETMNILFFILKTKLENIKSLDPLLYS